MEGGITNRQAIDLFQPNSALHDAVFLSMPKNADDIDKILHIYTKLCSMLSYDAEYWATENNDENHIPSQFLRHIKIEEINKISPTNPEVVCVDFNVIFGKMLDLAGVPFVIKVKGKEGENLPFFMYHTDIEIPLEHLKNPSPILKNISKTEQTCSLYLTFAGYYDMNNIKVLGEISNVNVRGYANDIEQFKNELNSKLKHIVSSEIGHSKQAIKCLLSEYEFNQKLEILMKKCVNANDSVDAQKSSAERLKLFFSSITQINMPTFPALLYASKLFDKTLSPLRDDNFIAEFSIIKEQKQDNQNIYDMVGLITIGPRKNITYIHFSPGKFIHTVDKEVIQHNFATMRMDYISNLMPRPKHLVPCIYSPYIEMRYKRLFSDLEKEALPAQNEKYRNLNCCTKELNSYFNKWHKNFDLKENNCLK